MGFRLIAEELNGLKVFEPEVFSDARGFFMESYRKDMFSELGLEWDFIQDNHSRSAKGVIRGMHFQWAPPQGKLIRVVKGSAFVVEVDIRKGSPDFGKYFSIELNDENRNLLWVPPGFANGFCSLSDDVDMLYKCTSYWNPAGESSILWNDPAIGIKWPTDNPIVSDRDSASQSLSQWDASEASNNFQFL